MKKKFTTAVLFAASLLVISGCSKKTKKTSDAISEPSTSQGETTLQPDPLSPVEESAAESSDEKSTTVSSTTAPTETTVTTDSATQQADPQGSGAFSYDDNGAVSFSTDISQQDDRTLIAAAQALFESACRTQWDYTVGCPYDVDYSDIIENQFGWQFCRITNSGINALSDVENDYYKVFSSRYPNQLDDLYIEQNGSVYVTSGARGMDLYYSSSQITEIVSRTDDEIFFTVENFYAGTDFNSSEAYSQTDTFSVVIDDSGTWKAGQFKLPY